MSWLKVLGPSLLAVVFAGCSFTGGNAPITEGPTSTTVYTVKPGDTLYAVARRYSLDPMTVARENNLENPSQLIVGQKLRLTISSDSRAKTTRTTTSSRSSSVSKSSATSAAAVTPVTTTTPSTSTTNSQKTVQQATASSDASMFGWPADGQVIESYGLTNKGIDIGGKNGTSVKAVAKGTVMFIGAPKGYGNLIIVRHSGDYVTAYGQLAKILVKQGDTVEKGEKIAEMGTSAEKGARVHFEIRKKGKPLDPSTLLPKV